MGSSHARAEVPRDMDKKSEETLDIAADVAKFFANGGKKQEIPIGVSGKPSVTLNDADKARIRNFEG